MKTAVIPAAVKVLPADVLILMFWITPLLPAAAKPVMSADTAMIVTQAAPPEKTPLTAADTMTLTGKPVYLAQRLHRRNRNVPLTAMKADVIVILVLTVAVEQDNVAVHAILPLLILRRRLIRHPLPMLNRKNRVVPIPAQAKDISHLSPAGSLVQQQRFAEIPVIIIASQAVLCLIAKALFPVNQATVHIPQHLAPIAPETTQ